MTDVLVVGAGPTGLTLACLLRRQGIAVRVVDRLAEPAKLAKATIIWSRSLEILDELGIAGMAVDAGIALEHGRFLDGTKELASTRTDCVPGTRWQPLILPQEQLERLLRERLATLGVEVEWGAQVTTLEADGDGVGATLLPADGRVECDRAGYIVGCDGLRSVVRSSAGIGWREHAPYDEVFQLGDVEAETSLDPNTVHFLLGRRGISVAIPMPGGLLRVVGYTDGVTPEGNPDRDALQQLLDDVGHSGTTITRVRWSGTFQVVRRLADTFRVGRVLLAGDAAHAHSPAGGQGLNTGIQDAYNLAWKLGLVVRGHVADKLLDSYTSERRPVAARILKLTELQDRHVFGARSPLARTMRNTALRVVERIGALERKVIPDLAQVTVSYPNSPLSISGGGRRSSYIPGSRVPKITFDAADGSGTITLRDPEPDGSIRLVAVAARGSETGLTEIEAFASEFPGALRLRQPATPLPDGGRAGLLMAVRPDGHIAYRGPCAVTPAFRAWVHATVSPPARLGALHQSLPAHT